MIAQGSEEWFTVRLGKVTASRLSDVMAKTRSGYGAARKNYMMELICQTLSGSREEGFTSSAMQRGIELEPEARNAYEFFKNVDVEETGFAIHSSIDLFGASPDGLVGEDGLLEIKCPNTATHFEFLKTGEPKREYILQMHGQMLCTGRSWCDFVSYDNRLQGLEFKCVRIERDDQLSEDIVSEVKDFIEELSINLDLAESMRTAA